MLVMWNTVRRRIEGWSWKRYNRRGPEDRTALQSLHAMPVAELERMFYTGPFRMIDGLVDEVTIRCYGTQWAVGFRLPRRSLDTGYWFSSTTLGDALAQAARYVLEVQGFEDYGLAPEQIAAAA